MKGRAANPRRAYRADGSMFSPVTVGDHLAGGYRQVEIHCTRCDHSGSIDVSALDPTLPIPDISLHARCSVCGSRDCTSRPDIAEYYRISRERQRERDATP